MVVVILLISGAVAVASVTLGADRRSPAATSAGAIAFVRHEAERTVIAVVDVATGRSRELVAVDGEVEGLDWSPDGRSLAFGTLGPDAGVFLTEVDGAAVRRVAAGIQPAWSPDGTRIAYRATDGEIHVMSAGGSDDVVLTDVGGASYPDWSADGHTIAFVGPGPRGHRHGLDVYSSNEDGSIVDNLTSHSAVDTEPAWSPTGATIVFRSDRATSSEDAPVHEHLFVMNAEGGNLIRITDDTTVTHAPAWSSDGRWIAFDDGRSIFVANADGSAITRVTDGRNAAWRPVVEEKGAVRSDDAAEAAADHDLGLAFDVCDITQVVGAFDAAHDGVAYVASKMDGGRCPPSLNAPQVVAVDIDDDGGVDATFDAPMCQDWCTMFAAPDVDGDGTSELLVQTAQFSIAGVQLYDVTADPPAIRLVIVRPPGEPPFDAGEPPQFWHGVDGYNAETLDCSGDGRARVLVASTAYQNPPESGPWAVHEAAFRLRDAELVLIHVRDLETEHLVLHADRRAVCGAPIRQDPSAG